LNEDTLKLGNAIVNEGDFDSLIKSIKDTGNAHFNYEFFWEGLAPISEGGGVKPDT